MKLLLRTFEHARCPLLHINTLKLMYEKWLASE
jgi:hypothetical protein